ncbi:MAG TPA: M48 family metallopeptidase [Oceanipulchritudo sp.]|nr:M48 family metallopeptidase [Oceanipulchritudo sp.]
MNTFLVLIAVLLILKTFAGIALDLLNRRRVLEEAGDVPETYRDFIDEPTYDKSVAYTLAKNRLSIVETLYDAVVLALILFTGLLPFLWDGATGLVGNGIWGQALALFGIFMILGLPGLPFEWYSQFRLEERFGFNKSTLGLWITDKLKGMAIGAVLGIPALAFLVWLVGLSSYWWLWGFVAFLLFQLVLVVLYPMFILPLFNKFEELPEGSLRRRLMELGDRTGFAAKTILVMDGSRRSGHSNAYFTGFGRFRRIVLYDTLIEQMEETQLESVLAHEIGHYKLGHIPKLLLLSAASLFVSFLVLGWLQQSAWFVEAFGFSATGAIGPVILLFGLLSGLVTFWISPLTNALSRRHEYEADAFAREALGNDPAPLMQALRVLSEKNLSNLTPHRLYSAFYYSHPTLLEREKSLLGET